MLCYRVVTMNTSMDAQITLRLPRELRDFYTRLAKAERRKLSDTIRLSLEDLAKTKRVSEDGQQKGVTP